jgi:non-specific serine/threonine protein kinase
MPLAAGTRLGRYEVVLPLGSGGMGEVYRARDTVLGRTVALKVVAQADAGRPDRLERFQREARAISRLSHPHICTLHDFGQEQDMAFLVMEDLEGETLADRLERGPLPVAEALRYGREMAEALDAAHRQGIVHRDLKPANVMLTRDGAKLLDFGLARLRQSEPEPARGGDSETLTQTGVVLGTLPYMAPEQIEGREADARSDIFALGVVLYEMVSGERPFRAGSRAGLITALLSSDPAPLGTLQPSVPPLLVRAIERCLAKDPDERWQSARDVGFELGTLAAGSEAGRPSGPLVLRPRSRKLLAASLVVLVVAGAVFIARRDRPPEPAPLPPGSKALAVLPFENLGPADDEYFADGVTDEVRGKLAALPGLLVIASTSSNQYKKTTKTPRQIGSELGVHYLLVGKVRWEKRRDGASRIRVSPELVHAATASTKWQQPFDAVVSDVFDVQATIATQVAQSLGVALGEGEREQLAERPTSNLAAWEAYVQGNQAARGFARPEDIRRAIGHYERAVALDPSFALAWARLSHAYMYLYIHSVPSAAVREQAKAAAERALALAPDLPAAHLAQAGYQGAVLGDWPRAAEQFALAVRKAPQDADLLTHASRAQTSAGRWEEALASLRHVQRIDPRSRIMARRLTVTLLWLRRYPEALEAADGALALAPEGLDLIQNKAMVFLARGDLAGARAVVKAAPREVDPTALVAYLAMYWDTLWLLDDEQQQLLLRLTPRPFGDDRLAWGLALAEVAALRGDPAKARAFAEQARAAAASQLEESPRDAQRHVLLGLALAYLGRTAEAMREGERGVALQPLSRDAYNGAYFQHQLARIYRRVGEPEKALDLLEGLLEIPYYLSPGWLRIDPEWDALREHPRFKKLVSRQPVPS